MLIIDLGVLKFLLIFQSLCLFWSNNIQTPLLTESFTCEHLSTESKLEGRGLDNTTWISSMN